MRKVFFILFLVFFCFSAFDSYSIYPTRPPKKSACMPTEIVNVKVYSETGALMYEGMAEMTVGGTLILDTEGWESGTYAAEVTREDGGTLIVYLEL